MNDEYKQTPMSYAYFRKLYNMLKREKWIAEAKEGGFKWLIIKCDGSDKDPYPVMLKDDAMLHSLVDDIDILERINVEEN